MEGTKIGMVDVGFSWGVITQCLQWYGVIAWPWQAIWLPFLILLGITIVLALIIVWAS